MLVLYYVSSCSSFLIFDYNFDLFGTITCFSVVLNEL